MTTMRCSTRLPDAGINLPIFENIDNIQSFACVQNQHPPQQALLLITDCVVLIQHLFSVLSHAEPLRLDAGNNVEKITTIFADFIVQGFLIR